MAKISTYPFPASPSLSDYVIGTDTNDSLNTKNFMISDILSLSGSSVYVPYIGATQDVDLGSNNLLVTNIVFNLGGTILDADGVEGTVGQVLSSQGPGLPPLWQDIGVLGYVPYTGATTDVNLGNYSIYTGGITFNNNGTIVDGNYVQGTLGQVLTSQGPGLSPLWQDVESLGYVPYTGATSNVDLGSHTLDTSSGIILSGATAPLMVNGSEGTTVQVLKSQGPGLSPIWANVSSIDNAYATVFNSVSVPSVNTFPASNVIDLSITSNNNITLQTTNIVQFAISGIYKITVNLSVINSSGSGHELKFFIRKNTPTLSVFVFDSKRNFYIDGNTTNNFSADYFVSVNSTDTLEFYFSPDSSTVSLLGLGSGPTYPATPSVVININKIS